MHFQLECLFFSRILGAEDNNNCRSRILKLNSSFFCFGWGHQGRKQKLSSVTRSESPGSSPRPTYTRDGSGESGRWSVLRCPHPSPCGGGVKCFSLTVGGGATWGSRAALDVSTRAWGWWALRPSLPKGSSKVEGSSRRCPCVSIKDSAGRKEPLFQHWAKQYVPRTGEGAGSRVLKGMLPTMTCPEWEQGKPRNKGLGHYNHPVFMGKAISWNSLNCFKYIHCCKLSSQLYKLTTVVIPFYR